MISLAGCSQDYINQKHYAFIGDSEIEGWNLKSLLPQLRTSNHGISGSGIEYLIESAGTMSGRNCVVLSGTNDAQHFSSETDAKSYAARFVEVVMALNADRTYILSVMPRNMTSDRSNLNLLIQALNSEIAEEIERRDNSKLHFVNTYTMLEYNGTINPNYTYDGLHLNDNGYFIISQALLQAIIQHENIPLGD